MIGLGHWTAAQVRSKADALEVWRGGRINLSPDTVELIVAALRFLAAEGLAERRCSFGIDVWDAGGNHVVEHIGVLSNHAAARAAFAAICDARPRHEVTLRQATRVVARQERG